MAQKRGFPKKWAIGFYVALAAATLGVLLWINLSRGQVAPLSPDERQDLAEVGEVGGVRLRHPLLGFSLAHPGPKFFRSAEAEGKLGFGHDPSTRFHAYTELDTGRLVIVALSLRPGMDGKAFATAVDSVANMFLQRTAAGFEKGAPIDILEQHVDRDRREARMHVQIAGKGHVRVNAWVSRFAGATDYLLVIVAVSPADDSLASVVASLHP